MSEDDVLLVEAWAAKYDREKAIADEIPDEETAFAVLYHVRHRFGWTTAVWTRTDVEERIDRKLTDAEWSEISESREWDSVSDIGYDAGAAGIWDLIIGTDRFKLEDDT